MAQFGSFNGSNAHVNGHASGSSPAVTASPSTTDSATLSSSQHLSPPGLLDEYSDSYADLANHLLIGYTEALYSDFTLHVNFADPSQPPTTLALHAVVVSRSPLLRSLIQPAFNNTPHPTLLISIPDPSITASSFSLALASLYSPTVLSHLSLDNCAALFSTAQYLGLERLTQHSFALCQQAVADAKTIEHVQQWVQYLEDQGVSPSAPSSYYMTTLRDTLLTRLTALPTELNAFTTTDMSTARLGQEQLIQMLTPMPFEWFKLVVEDKRFSTPSELDRFNFAKKAVAARKQHFQSIASMPNSHPTSSTGSVASSSSPSSPTILQHPASSPVPPYPPHHSKHQHVNGSDYSFDEAVVLGFGSGGTSAVNVLRKMRKPHLWKVGPAATRTLQ
ncbi:uncharacterized protein JCM15063_002173 [Sporobolomyces koalae]|uniref:uncharacterized protein n=1 Tax=Sporobolomyces koalae TaxID=500713 RepID=UPI003173CB52